MFNSWMKTRLSFFIGYRYLRRSRDEKFISFISALSMWSMAIGVATLVVVLSIMNGFDREIKTRLLKIVPHVTVEASDGVSSNFVNILEDEYVDNVDVISIDPKISSNALLFRDEVQIGVGIEGLDSTWRSYYNLNDHMIAGNLGQLEAGSFRIVIGSQISRQMNAFIGDEISLVFPLFARTPFGLIPRTKKFTVAGIFEVGAQVDGAVSFINETDLRRIVGIGKKFQGLNVYLSDPLTNSSKFIVDAKSKYPELEWLSLEDEMTALFQAMRMEKLAVSLILSVIIAVASFNIIASLILSINKKRGEIAVLRTMGASSKLITNIFLVQGMLGSIFGILIGIFIGIMGSVFIDEIVKIIEHLFNMKVFDPSIYLISEFPSQIVASDILFVVLGTISITFLATIFPAKAAGKVMPAEALRYGN